MTNIFKAHHQYHQANLGITPQQVMITTLHISVITQLPYNVSLEVTNSIVNTATKTF